MSGQYKTEWDKLFIGGKWTDPSTDRVIPVHSPATGEYVGRVPMAAATDVDTAVATAPIDSPIGVIEPSYSLYPVLAEIHASPVVHADTTAKFGPLKPYMIETLPEIMLMIAPGIRNGEMRRGPRLTTSE